jgi:O-antigen ligase
MILLQARSQRLMWLDAARPAFLLNWRIDSVVLGLAMGAVPVSIAIAESLLAIALLIRIGELVRHRSQMHLPRVFWFWLAWAALEVLSWVRSPEIGAGGNEMRHLALIGALFLLLPALDQAAHRAVVWRCIFLSATLGSAFLIGGFFSRLTHYQREISLTADTSFYLRNGGLLHHWMVYGTVEIMVFAGLLEFWSFYPRERGWCFPVLIVNCLAILLSLTRMLWVGCLLVLALHLIRRRSRWIWAVPLLLFLLFAVAPGAVRSRVAESLRPDYYSNAERLQMLRVGWRMILDHPIRGVGPGRVEKLYPSYLSPDEPEPVYHGHLHNNLVQLAAEFGLPTALAGILFVAVLFRDLARHCRVTADRDNQFLCHAALLGMTGFLAAGMFDYTYGHSLGLILFSFVVISPLMSQGSVAETAPSS